MNQKDKICDSNVIISRRASQYESFWGRRPDLILHPSETRPHIDIFRFPPIDIKWFFQKWFIPVSHQYVYISGGMSDVPISKKNLPSDVLSQIELTAFSNEIYMNHSQKTDMIAWWLSFLAYTPFKDETIFFAPGHTFSVGKPIIPDSQMTAFFFAVSPPALMQRLCSASINAKLVLQAVPITESELKFAKKEGIESLIDYFEKYHIEPFFDLNRDSYL